MIPVKNLKRFFYKALRQPVYALKVFLRRTQAAIYYDLSDGRSSPPETITLFLTHNCNLRCRMCGQWGDRGVTKIQDGNYIHSELTREELLRFVAEVAPFKPNITLFGGEPLLYRGCAELIAYIKKQGMHCLMITNGSLLEHNAAKIVESGLDELNISLDGARELHDSIRGMPGLLDRIVSGLQEVRKFKSAASSKKPLVNLQCTISQFNYLKLEQLIDVAKEVGADSLTYHNLIFLAPELIERQKHFDELLGCDSKNWEGFVSQPQIDPMLLYDKISGILAKKYPFNVDFYPNFSKPGLIEYYSKPAFVPSEYRARCLSPWVVAYVFPDGEVRPCLNLTHSFGNIKKESFLKIWNSAQAVKLRRLIKQEKLLPTCIRCTELYRY